MARAKAIASISAAEGRRAVRSQTIFAARGARGKAEPVVSLRKVANGGDSPTRSASALMERAIRVQSEVAHGRLKRANT